MAYLVKTKSGSYLSGQAFGDTYTTSLLKAKKFPSREAANEARDKHSNEKVVPF